MVSEQRKILLAILSYWEPVLPPVGLARLKSFLIPHGYCADCNGNFLLKNIFKEHNLSMKEEMELKRRMARFITETEEKQVKEVCN